MFDTNEAQGLTIYVFIGNVPTDCRQEIRTKVKARTVEQIIAYAQEDHAEYPVFICEGAISLYQYPKRALFKRWLRRNIPRASIIDEKTYLDITKPKELHLHTQDIFFKIRDFGDRDGRGNGTLIPSNLSPYSDSRMPNLV